MDDKLTAIQYGIGPIGSRIATAAYEMGFEFVGAIDIDPDKVGCDLGDVAGFGEPIGVEVTDDAADALAAEPDVVFHSTVSSVEAAMPQLTEVVAAGGNIVSTTEELAYPQWNEPDLAAELDDLAREHDVTVLGAGINPGFVMDSMAAFLTTPMERVDAVTVTRVQDAAKRRKPLQEKVGAGVSVETFQSEIATEAGHVGSTASTAMLADALDIEIDTIEESIEPVVAEEYMETDFTTIEPGEVAGIRQVAHGYVDDERRITLDIRISTSQSSVLIPHRNRKRPPLMAKKAGEYCSDHTMIGGCCRDSD